MRARAVDLQILDDDPRVQLFAGEEGLFPGVEAWEATPSVGREARLARDAVTPDDREVIVAARFGARPRHPHRHPRLRDAAGSRPRERRAAGPHLDPAEDGMSADEVDPLLAVGAIVAALLAGAALARPAGARVRAAAMLLALALTPALLLAEIWDAEQFESLRDRPALALGAARGRAARRRRARGARPPPAVAGCRSPRSRRCRSACRSPPAATTSSLLVPLYLVIAAGVLAYAVPRLRARRERRRGARARRRWVRAPARRVDRPVRRAGGVLDRLRARAAAGRVLLRAVRAARDAARAGGLDARAARPLPRRARRLAVVFVAIGFVEYATRSLLLNPKVIASNQFETYFRVNSLFFDPNIYGRFLAIVMLAAHRGAAVGAATRGSSSAARRCSRCLWGGLVLTLSQSSFTALLAGLVVLAALRWGTRPAAVAARGGARRRRGRRARSAGRSSASTQDANDATSGRCDAHRGRRRARGRRSRSSATGRARSAREYRRAENASGERATNASHTSADHGRGRAGRDRPARSTSRCSSRRSRCCCAGARASVARAGVAAAFVALVVHTLMYAAFLEDPLAWALLAAGIGLAGREP